MKEVSVKEDEGTDEPIVFSVHTDTIGMRHFRTEALTKKGRRASGIDLMEFTNKNRHIRRIHPI